MTTQACKNCNRPLTSTEKTYCPHCTAQLAGKVGKVGGILSTVVSIGMGILGVVVTIRKITKR